MRIVLLSVGLWAAGLGALAGDALIVKQSGESVIAKDVEQTAAQVSFADAAGARQELPMADVYQVLPRVVRGQTYPPEQVQKTIALIRQTAAKFRKLEKQIRPLLDEWRALERQTKTATPETKGAMEAEVARLCAEYAKGPKDPPAFARLNSDLGMIKYKDVRNEYGPTIDARLAELLTDFLAVHVARLEQLAAKPAPTVADFEAASNLAGTLTVYQPPAAQATKIAALLEQTRLAGLAAGTARARQTFAAAKNVGGYLQANVGLVALEQHLVREPERPGILKLRQELQTALAGFDFGLKGFEDYPITAADKQALATFKVFRTITPSGGEPQVAALIPSRFPPPLTLAAPYSLPVRAVFRLSPPPKLGLLLLPTNTFVAFPETKVTDGHAELLFRCDFSKLTPEAAAELGARLANAQGQKVMALFLVRWWADERGARQWAPISWGLPLLVE